MDLAAGKEVRRIPAVYAPMFMAVTPDESLYDVGTAGVLDRDQKEFDTPALIELWRTAPYLHDGSAPALLELLTTHNKADAHGKTSQLSKEDLEALVEYLFSL